MSEPLRIIHGAFGRVALLLLDRTMAVHAHRVCHVVFKIGGAGADILFGVREREHHLSDDNVLLVNAWEPHFYDHIREAPSTVLLALYLEPQWLRTVDRRFSCSAHPKFFFQPVVALGSKLAGLRTDLLDLLMGRESTSSRVVEDLIVRIIIELTCVGTRWKDLLECQLTGGLAYDARIRHSLDLMKARGGVALDFDEIASSVGLSRPHFFHLFRRQIGMTPATFGSMLRMEASIDSLVASDSAIHDIALNLGFDAPGSFTRFFLYQQGVTPSQYRRKVELLPSSRV
ncbi:helix-turn-helix transcriptional regulator [Caballeronia sp. LjRoot31]|uniref:helix-turn-helix transcriptional regulator n=1 Tax=Caballeronia sp. LjRoot31 TaxID=3342324 RepID=UPI003ECD2BE7